MRIRDIVKIIDNNIDGMDCTMVGMPNDPNNIKFSNIFGIRKGIIALESTSAFTSELSNLNKHNFLHLSLDDEITIPTDMAVNIRSQIQELQIKMRTFRSVAVEILPEQSELSLSVMFPKIHDLAELADYSSKLDKILSQLLVNKDIDGKAVLQNFDTGSEWIELVFNSAKSLGAIASLVYIVILTKREAIKNQESLEVIRNRKITNDLFEQLASQLQKNTENFINNKIKENMVDMKGENIDNEYFERYKFCVNEMGKLIDKGMKFFPSSKSPNDIKSTLPDFSQKDLKDMLPETQKIESNLVEDNAETLDNQG